MSCKKINFILDAKHPEELTPAERQAVERHFASCAECRDVWGAYRELVALPVPSTPPDLRARIMVTLAARPAAAGWGLRRSFVIGAVLVAGAAAATLAFRLVDRTVEDEPRSVEATAPAPAPRARVEPEPDGALVAPSAAPPGVGESPPQPAVRNAAGYPLDRHSVVVIAVPDPAGDSEMAAALATCHEVVLEHLRAVDGLNIIAEERLAPFAGSALSETEMARALGAGSVLTLRSAEREPSCSARLVGVEDVLPATGLLVFLHPEWTHERWQSFAAGLAGRVREVLLSDPATLRGQAQADILNTALSDAQRVSALERLRVAGPFAPQDFDASVIAAAIQIGMTSRDAEARAVVWTYLRGVKDPAVLQPLLYALANDPVARVRATAAQALGGFLAAPGVRDALLRAAAEDADDQPTVVCCIPTVRESARIALRGDLTPHDAVRSAALDESLAPRERLLFLSPQGLIMRLDAFDADVARAVFALGSAADDPGLRARAWGLLADVREPDFKAPLIVDLAQHPAENVRTAAARGLRQLRDDPEVRAALERALSDASADVQRTARASLDGVGAGTGL
jgi:hypothetical protein